MVLYVDPIYTRLIICVAELTILQKKGYSHTTVWKNSRIPELEVASAEGQAETSGDQRTLSSFLFERCDFESVIILVWDM